MQAWLIVQRIENWRVDYSGNFSNVGLPASRIKMAKQIEVGDRLVTYIASRRSAISDIREVTSVTQSRRAPQAQAGYDGVYPFVLKTRPLIVLAESAWFPIQNLIPLLSLTRGVGDWRQLFRNSLRRLTENDYQLIEKTMKKLGPPHVAPK